ncbi:hypothetical protein CHS0354_017041 [Potamilus streckersoni]|uniref:Uncharacterized protein n=1 Tax=Potamilus streckersoni TaxID=2493646 RepID=A0AAE0W4G9_9BIVA|nr:hypothetical protein CHS0354_017041 [Potamilus streckersoni]
MGLLLARKSNSEALHLEILESMMVLMLPAVFTFVERISSDEVEASHETQAAQEQIDGSFKPHPNFSRKENCSNT